MTADSCAACDRPAVARSPNGHPLCVRHAGGAASLADELHAEREASRHRTAGKRDADLARCRRLAAEDERVHGDAGRRARGTRIAAARRNNRASDTPASPRADYDRQRYLAQREKRIAQVMARQRLLAAPAPKSIRTYRSDDA